MSKSIWHLRVAINEITMEVQPPPIELRSVTIADLENGNVGGCHMPKNLNRSTHLFVLPSHLEAKRQRLFATPNVEPVLKASQPHQSMKVPNKAFVGL
jgi:hypothetical protein